MIEKKRDMIIFLDEGNKEKQFFVNITRQTDLVVEFFVNGRKIIIPMHRIIKIKRGLE